MASVLNEKNGMYTLLNLTQAELKLLRSSLLKWNGDLSAMDKDLLLMTEEDINACYRDLLDKLQAELKTISRKKFISEIKKNNENIILPKKYKFYNFNKDLF